MPPVPRRSQTADEVAAARAATMLDPALSANEAARAAEAVRLVEALAAQQRNIQGFSLAEADLLRGVGQQVQSGYDLASQRQSTIAKGYSDGFRMATQGSAEGINADLAKQGAPTGQYVTGGTGADVLYGLGGAIPASTLNREGAAFGAAASMLPQTALGRGEMTMRDASRSFAERQREIEDRYANERRQIEAQRPGIIQQALQDIRANNLKRQELAQERKAATAATKRDARDFAFKVALAEREFGLKEGELGLRLRSQGFDERATLARIKNEARRIANEENRLRVQIDRDLRNAGIQDEKLALGWANLEARIYGIKQGKKKGRKTLTPKQRADFNGTAAEIAEGAYRGLEATDEDPAAPPIGYQDALREMYKEGIPLTIAQAALNRYYRPGERGRPRVSFQERQRRRRASRRQSQGSRNAPR